MKVKMVITGLVVLVVAVVILIIVFWCQTKKGGLKIIVVAGKTIQLSPKRKFVAEIGEGKKQEMWIQRYEPPYDENQPYLKSIEEADWSTPEGAHFSETSAGTVDWFKRCYTSKSWARMKPSFVEKQLKIKASSAPSGAFFRFYYKLEFQKDGKHYALLFYGIDDEKTGGPFHKEGVLWYVGYVKEADGWKRDSFLAAMSNLANPRKDNPLAVYFDNRLDELDKLSQAIK